MNAIFSAKRSGSIMINAIIMVFFLVATGTAFMMWAVDESYQADFDLARAQANYVAQHGILSEALTVMRSRTQNALPGGYERLTDGTWKLAGGNSVGEYKDTGIRRVDSNQDVNIFQTVNQYDLEGTGVVQITGPFGRKVDVERSLSMRTQLRTYASYMYLTNQEMTDFGEIIWFWRMDTLFGRVHSNSPIGLHPGAVFYGPVSSTANAWAPGSTPGQCYFEFEPQLGAPHVYFPETAENLRSGAASGGGYISNADGTLQSRLTATTGGWSLEQWSAGIPYDVDRIDVIRSISYGGALFIEGDCEFIGSMGSVGTIAGRTTVGTSGNLELLDNVLYAGYTAGTLPDTFPSSFTPMLGLVSEGKIIIKDVDANGRGNGLSQPGGHDRKHIIITAAIVALGQQFTFEHQNDTWNTYRWCDPAGDHSGELDERGSIMLRGAVSQAVRGYVHRSNCGGTGYAKDYFYDFRLEKTPPPFYLEAVDDEGASLFDIVWWKEEPVK